MNLHKSDDFIKEVISYIKFPFDRDEIEKELEEHILDKIEYYHNQGMDNGIAEELTLKDMGNPKEIGIALNKEHNPILGWIYVITSVLVAINLFILIFSLSISLLNTIFSRNPAKDIPKENIVYNIKLDEKVKIDDRVIKFKNLIYEKNGDMTILYEYYETNLLFGRGWSLGSIGTVKDDLGNEYFAGSGSSSGGIITKGVITLSDFPLEATTLIIEYDSYNRYYKLEVPLKAGDLNE
ncbi:MAG: permease prefix domain 1-containing protein [Tissierellaceae bacterium]|nr:permease prefix domain 1-containing protein [Tissierellaceae bacterium]